MPIITDVSTEGRIFVSRLTRDLAARERAAAALLSPGTSTWPDAFHAFMRQICKTPKPTKAAALFRGALDRLRAAQKNRACFVNCFEKRSRSAFVEVLTYQVAKHPLMQTGNEGIIVRVFMVRLQRNGRVSIGTSKLAFIDWHALGRMYERSTFDVFDDASGLVAGIGFTGLIMRESEKHHNNSISFATEDMTCVGVLRFATNEEGKTYGFFDVRTVLPADADKPYQVKQREQAIRISWAVHNYLEADDADAAGYGDDIPVVPFDHSDSISRRLAVEKAQNSVDRLAQRGA